MILQYIHLTGAITRARMLLSFLCPWCCVVTMLVSTLTLTLKQYSLRWLNTVLQAVSGNSRDGACFKLDQQTWQRKSNGTQNTISKNLLIKICDIWQNLYFYRILNDENFKMEVQQTNFVTDLIITEQSYH